MASPPAAASPCRSPILSVGALVRGEPHLVGRYEIRERLGAGGFASVYRAYDPLLDIERAIKVLHAHHADDPTIRDRFILECRSLARFRHPILV